MADILIRLNDSHNMTVEQNKAVERISADPQCNCWIDGKDNTFCIVRHGDDAIASIGYVCHIDGDSIQETLSQILSSFNESQIVDLKKILVGQYVLLVKKGDSIYLFSDFMGARNIFYSDDGRVISSSFSKVENILGTSASDLDTYKVFEFLAMRHVLYPTWIGRTTEHRRIKWLLPYEYLVINTTNSSYRLGSIVYMIDNKKQSDCSLLSNELLSTLRAIIGRREFKNSPVAASLTGGRDSRLVAAIAAEQFPNIHYRTAVSSERFTSLKDFEVADKIAKIRGIPLDVYRFQPGQDEERFCELTEGFAPSFNHSITPLIDSAGSYSLGFGGVYGTELFMPIPWNSIDNYVQRRIESAKQALRVENGFWNYFRESLHDEFRRTKDHFQLSSSDDRDYIRLFNLLDTARYSSFILSAFNRAGYQLEPYGSYSVLDLALRVAPALWGNHKRLGGNALVQKTAMAKLDPRLARVMTYSTFRPMLPLSITSAPFYLMGFTLQVADWLRDKFDDIKKEPTRTDLPGGYYLSNGWEKQFLGRTVKKYGLPVTS
jgi:hypothetical protein